MKSAQKMTALERVLTALSFKEPDRVPFFLLLTTHGARELGMSIKDYFSDPEAVCEGQLRMQARYGHDCLYAFTHAAVEVQAFGGSVSYVEDGSPNAATPPLQSLSDIAAVTCPDIRNTPSLTSNLKAIRLMRQRAGKDMPIIGVVMSPFSLPVMQLGFPFYLDLLLENEAALRPLWDVNVDFCIAWANAQLEAGATAICYFDPLASPDMIPPELYRRTGKLLATKAIKNIKGPTATHLASGRSQTVLADLAETGTAVVGVSQLDSLAGLKQLVAGRLSLLGNLNALLLRNQSQPEINAMVRAAIQAGAPGGGFILAENHGELPWAVPEDALDKLAAAVLTCGGYPIRE